MPDEHDAHAGLAVRVEQTGAFGDRHDVRGEDRQVVGAVIGGRIREPVAAQVHRDEPARARGSPEAARDRGPDPAGLREPVDGQDPRLPSRSRRPVPVQKMDPVPGLGHDHEPIRFERRIRCRYGGG